jgi:hypothetical protein
MDSVSMSRAITAIGLNLRHRFAAWCCRVLAWMWTWASSQPMCRSCQCDRCRFDREQLEIDELIDDKRAAERAMDAELAVAGLDKNDTTVGRRWRTLKLLAGG